MGGGNFDFVFRLDAPCPKNYNPADYFIQLLAIVPEKEAASRQAANVICNKFERSTVGVKIALEAGSGVMVIFLNGSSFKKFGLRSKIVGIMMFGLMVTMREVLIRLLGGHSLEQCCGDLG